MYINTGGISVYVPYMNSLASPMSLGALYTDDNDANNKMQPTE